MMQTPPCPLAQAERRLDDAVKLWGKASASYFEPDDFRVHLQACIQAFRSVTWILQSHKHAIANFDVWYAGWQHVMRADPILRWLVGARNKIEKQGDLEARAFCESPVRVHGLMIRKLSKNYPQKQSHTRSARCSKWFYQISRLTVSAR